MIRSLTTDRPVFTLNPVRAWGQLSNRQLILQIIQPGLAGFMDGSVSTLAPLFAVALATRDPRTTFLVGLAAAVGAGISMAFAEALSDDGVISGRGNPWLRGLVEGVATFFGGLGHALPFLLPDVHTALPVACLVVAVELLLISWVRFHYFHMQLTQSMLQVLAGGALVFAELATRRLRVAGRFLECSGRLNQLDVDGSCMSRRDLVKTAEVRSSMCA
jgi:VIT1/CCC1 family predicted Fe2+/Mn2+ transporter